MFTTLKNIISDSSLIFKKKYLSFGRRVALFFAYMRLAAKRFLEGRIPGIVNEKAHNFLGFHISFENFSDFYWTFREVFIHDDYYFFTKKNDPFIVDCGGNIGVTILYFKYLYPNARILAFEALPENAEILENNIKSNNLTDVEVVRKAVAEHEGELAIYGDRRAATIRKELIDEQNKKNDDYKGKKIMVPLVRLSEFLKNKQVDFLKLDIEGAEGGVLDDLSFQKKVRDIEQIAMEYHKFSPEENKLSTIIDILEQNDFDITFTSDFSLKHMPKRAYYNFMLYGKRR